MNTETSSLSASQTPPLHDMPASARRVVGLLQKLRHGSLSVMWPDGRTTQFGQHDDARPGLHAHLHLHNWKPLSEAIKSGDIGFAEGYIAGDWSTPHLPELLQLLVANRREMEDLIYGHWLGRLVYRVRHLLHRNTRRNSAKNIHAHYDLGNAFYQLWLDPTMNYSSAWFGADRQSAPRLVHGRRQAWRPGDGDWMRLGRAGRDGWPGVWWPHARRDAEP